MALPLSFSGTRISMQTISSATARAAENWFWTKTSSVGHSVDPLRKTSSFSSLRCRKAGRGTARRLRDSQAVSLCFRFRKAIAPIRRRFKPHSARRFVTPPQIRGGAGQGLQVACDGSNINPVAIKILQAKNPDRNYFNELGFARTESNRRDIQRPRS